MADGQCMPAKDSVRRAWFADSQFSSAPGLRVRADLRDRDRHTADGRANSAAVRIPPALRARDSRRVQEWAEARAGLHRRRAGQRVRADRHDVRDSRLSRAKKKAR